LLNAIYEFLRPEYPRNGDGLEEADPQEWHAAGWIKIHQLEDIRSALKQKAQQVEITEVYMFLFSGTTHQRGQAVLHSLSFLDHTAVVRIPLDEGSAHRRDNTHHRQISMCPAGFKPAIPASDRP
jgi:hypothetical protein